ncbi:MAG: Flp pilus assembly complex ATPase component TadA [Pseudomonadales bacterium]|nr:Flp pilus assembly complex ATPase component TadA [Pseudomonadales bacterium]MCP5357659.1 Flp pilus assembly complex ATPase component TadA [Pseudomonadales bacterium]
MTANSSARKQDVMSGKPVELGAFVQALLQAGRIAEADAQALLARRRDREDLRKPLLAWLAEQNLVDQAPPHRVLDIETLTRFLADQAGQDYYRIDPLKIDVAQVTQVMSYAFTQRHNILAVEVRPLEVLIASTEPFISSWEADLEHVLQKRIRRVVANPLEIKRLTTEFYSLANSISHASKSSGRAPGLSNLEQMLELGNIKDPEANDQHIVSIVDWLLQYAFDQRASDIHIEPRREKGNVRFRIDGVLYTVYALPMQVMNAVTSRIKILGRMNVAEKRRPQDGRLKTKSPGGEEIELRLSTLPTAFGEKLVMRIFDPEVLLRPFESLGLSGEDLQRWKEIVGHKHGIVIITGPTGSGKTTTLYSTLKMLATDEVNVCTIEDPIEMVEPQFNQMQVQDNIDLDFASGVKALLRQDPDIIMIGEVRDLETAEMAIQAALTGHLVFTTLHTNDAPSAITRLLELGVAPYLIKATVVGVVAQRLVRVLCPHCKKDTEINEAEWTVLTSPWKLRLPKNISESVGCLECRETGFKGRQGIYEIMPLSDTLQHYVDDKSDLPKLRQQAYKEGMRSLRLSGALKVASGTTTVNEVLRVTPEQGG